VPFARGGSPSGEAARRELAARLEAGLARLKTDDRLVIELRTVQGLSWAEVGRRMERTEEASRALWGRACARLGALVEGE
jgi:DNA-directed RNA polymerase specialized sigma24 family protein